MTKDNEWGNIELPGLSDEELFTKNWNRSAAQKEKYKSPLYKEKYSENPDWIEPLKKKRSESLKTKESSKKISDGLKKRYEKLEERIKTSNASKLSYKNDPLRKEKARNASKKTWSNKDLRKQASESHKKQWEDPNKRKQLSESMKSIRKYPMMCKGQWFESSQAAADFFGISKDMIGYYRKKYPKEYYYCDKKPHSNKKK